MGCGNSQVSWSNFINMFNSLRFCINQVPCLFPFSFIRPPTCYVGLVRVCGFQPHMGLFRHPKWETKIITEQWEKLWFVLSINRKVSLAILLLHETPHSGAGIAGLLPTTSHLGMALTRFPDLVLPACHQDLLLARFSSLVL